MKWLKSLFTPSPYRISDDDRRAAILSVLRGCDLPISRSDQIDYIDLASKVAPDAPPISESLLRHLVGEFLIRPRTETHCANSPVDIVIYRVVKFREKNTHCLLEWVSAFEPAEDDYIRRHFWIEGKALKELGRLPGDSWHRI